MKEIDAIRLLDNELIEAARDIKVLSALAWPVNVQSEFLSEWPGVNRALPRVTYRRIDAKPRLHDLDSITKRAEAIGHPLAKFVADTARSYHNTARLLEHLGQHELTDLSIAIYGKPGDVLTGAPNTTSIDAARFFLRVSQEFDQRHPTPDAEFCVPASVVRAHLESKLPEVLGPNAVKIDLDPDLASKAAAGASRIRLRDATCFSVYDMDQLLQHEAFVHALTAQNGRQQKQLRSLSLGAPRTTAAQEGLATFAELITGAIDMARLERISMRIIAIDMALNGADFIEVFKYFLNAGQPETESFQSAMRVFRGAPVQGGAAFTKDSVYLHGLLEVHTFFRWALSHHRLELCQHFFAGRMTLGDVIRLEPYFDDGTLSPPKFLPPWMTRTTGLGGFLAFSVFTNAISLETLDSAHAFESLDR